MTKYYFLLLTLLLSVLLSASASADALYTYDNFVDIQYSKFGYLITDKDLTVSLAAEIIDNGSSEAKTFDIRFDPREWPESPPIVLNGARLCLGWVTGGGKYYGTQIYCEANASYERYSLESLWPYVTDDGLAREINYSTYLFTVTRPDIKKHDRYALQINYTIKDAIFRQGDFYVARLRYQLHKAKKTESYLELPDKDSIPRFIPQNTKRSITSYYGTGSQIFWRWGFEFEGANEAIVWYLNDKQLKIEEKERQEFWTNVGVKRGLLWSALIAAIFLLLEKIVEWAYGDRIKQLLVTKLLRRLPFIKKENVVGNLNTFTYHKPTCYAIRDVKQSKTFCMFEEAEAELYTPCKQCRPQSFVLQKA